MGEFERIETLAKKLIPGIAMMECSEQDWHKIIKVHLSGNLLILLTNARDFWVMKIIGELHNISQMILVVPSIDLRQPWASLLLCYPVTIFNEWLIVYFGPQFNDFFTVFGKLGVPLVRPFTLKGLKNEQKKPTKPIDTFRRF